MNSTQQERFYWRIAVLVLVGSPIWLWSAAQHPLPFQFWMPYGPFLLMLTFPVLAVVEYVRTLGTSGRRFWVREPTVHVEAVPEVNVDIWWEGFVRRATGLGFQCLAGEIEDTWRVSKGKADNVVSFVEHAFDGQVALTQGAAGLRVSIDLMMRDTLIVETGETAQLTTLAGYLLGTETKPAARTLPLMVICALTLTTVAHAMGYATIAGLCRPGMPVLEASALSIILAVFGLAAILKKPEQLLGLRLTVATLAAAAVPWVGLLVQPMLGY